MPGTDCPILRVEKLSKHFGGVHAVRDVDLELRAGERCGLIGPNGAGKSTLFDCITGLIRSDAGRIFLDGRDVTRWSMDRLAREGKAVRSFQKTVVYASMTVEDNLVVAGLMHTFPGVLSTFLPSTGAHRRLATLRRRAAELLELVGLSHFRDVPALEMSFGQQKLLQFAGALMPDPRVVLLDEPFAGVNPVLIEQNGEAIVRVNEAIGITFFVIEHNVDALLKICHRILVMSEGSIIADGRGSALMDDPKVVEAYLGG